MQEKNAFVKVYRLNKPEKWYLIVGLITSILIGGMQAAFTVIYSEIFHVSVCSCISMLPVPLDRHFANGWPCSFIWNSKTIEYQHVWLENLIISEGSERVVSSNLPEAKSGFGISIWARNELIQGMTWKDLRPLEIFLLSNFRIRVPKW